MWPPSANFAPAQHECSMPACWHGAARRSGEPTQHLVDRRTQELSEVSKSHDQNSQPSARPRAQLAKLNNSIHHSQGACLLPTVLCAARSRPLEVDAARVPTARVQIPPTVRQWRWDGADQLLLQLSPQWPHLAINAVPASIQSAACALVRQATVLGASHNGVAGGKQCLPFGEPSRAASALQSLARSINPKPSCASCLSCVVQAFRMREWAERG
eukprot:SAG31_NODE_1952_length_6830_cov_12.132487_1_plen_214_part_10